MLALQAMSSANLAVFPLFNSPTCLWKTQNNLRSLDSTDPTFCMHGHGWVVYFFRGEYFSKVNIFRGNFHGLQLFVCMGMGGWWEEVEALLGRSHQLLSNGKTAHIGGQFFPRCILHQNWVKGKLLLSGTNGFRGQIRDIDTQSSFVGTNNSQKK